MMTAGAPMESLRSGSGPQWPAEEVRPAREESGGGGALRRKSAMSAAIPSCVRPTWWSKPALRVKTRYTSA